MEQWENFAWHRHSDASKALADSLHAHRPFRLEASTWSNSLPFLSRFTQPAFHAPFKSILKVCFTSCPTNTPFYTNYTAKKGQSCSLHQPWICGVGSPSPSDTGKTTPFLSETLSGYPFFHLSRTGPGPNAPLLSTLPGLSGSFAPQRGALTAFEGRFVSAGATAAERIERCKFYRTCRHVHPKCTNATLLVLLRTAMRLQQTSQRPPGGGGRPGIRRCGLHSCGKWRRTGHALFESVGRNRCGAGSALRWTTMHAQPILSSHWKVSQHHRYATQSGHPTIALRVAIGRENNWTALARAWVFHTSGWKVARRIFLLGKHTHLSRIRYLLRLPRRSAELLHTYGRPVPLAWV